MLMGNAHKDKDNDEDCNPTPNDSAWQFDTSVGRATVFHPASPTMPAPTIRIVNYGCK